MADVETKPGQSKGVAGPAALGIPSATAKSEKRTIAAGKSAHSMDLKGRLGALKTFLWVAPLTALIWIYAEREQIKPAEVKVEIRLVPQSNDRIITVSSPLDRSVWLDIQGPSASLTELRDALAKGPLEVRVNSDIGYKGEIPITEAITKGDLFRAHAVEAKASRPAVTIKVEAKASRKVPVKVRPGQEQIGTPIFEPDFVMVEGPKDALERDPQQELVAYADISKFKSSRPGEHVDDVPITLNKILENVTMNPSVRARIKIGASQNYSIPPIPIVVNVSGLVLSSDKFRITTPETLAGVEVSGPLEQIELLKQRKLPASVVVDLNRDGFINFDAIQGTTVDRAYTLRASDYRMPEGVTVVNPTKDINVSISRR